MNTIREILINLAKDMQDPNTDLDRTVDCAESQIEKVIRQRIGKRPIVRFNKQETRVSIFMYSEENNKFSIEWTNWRSKQGGITLFETKEQAEEYFKDLVAQASRGKESFI